ncbi:hypothetical protein BHYA_0116g00240 [Botrytis hyacinthi]|uniref:Uncharacterized protein n=1 Tax=Botrytis hyacinthi TaxID=278943 RepID=A0A4Z1GJA1_9HELO|nr:hypothetical protein BHYA_0116g00240 [Botrytis hyacinthi]
MEISQEVQLEPALRREDRALQSSTPTSISASIKASKRALAPTTFLSKGFPAFRAAKWQLTIESCGDYQVPGSNFLLDMAQLRHHDRRIYRSRHILRGPAIHRPCRTPSKCSDIASAVQSPNLGNQDIFEAISQQHPPVQHHQDSRLWKVMSIYPSSPAHSEQSAVPRYGAFVGGKFQALAQTQEE